ncbi:MAG: TonB-dependent receptor [Ignavibacteria bacterium]|nr:TonB-dependent receptor [Ignavibacteria bacterium]
MNFIPTFCVLIITCTNALAQVGTINGFVTDREDGSPLAGVSIGIEGTQLGAITNSSGRFVLRYVPIGKISIKATLIGYEPTSVTAFIKDDGSIEVVLTMLQTSIKTGEIIVSANKTVQNVQDVPISVSTVNQRELTQRNVTRLDEALRYVSGVNVVRDQISVRGTSGFAFGVGSRTMVLLDGFPVLSGDNGDVKFEVMPVADVERIEVIKGAGSALYGTGALGGVVSMFTESPKEGMHINARVYGGAYTEPRYGEWKYRTTVPTQWGADLRATQTIDKFSINLSGGIRSDESYRQFDRSLRGFGWGKVQWKPVDKAKLTVATLFSESNVENFIYWKDLRNATRPPPAQDLNERLWTQKIAVFGEWMQLIDSKTSLTIRPGMYRTRFENRVDNAALDSNQSIAYAWNVDGHITHSFSEVFTATSGISGKINAVRADVYGNQLQTLFSAFTQGEYTFDNSMIITAGLRADREETYSLPAQLEFSPKLGMSWKLLDALHIRASVGRGFRAATIAERYANIKYGPFDVKPNPNIKPETSWSAELGMRYSTTEWLIPIELDAAVFDNELYDLIEPTFAFDDPNVPIQFTNVTRARIFGMELTARAMVSKDIAIASGITAMLPKDLILNETLKYRNNILWYTLGSWTPFESLEFQAEYRFQSRVQNIDNRLVLFIPDAGARVAAHVVDLRLFWTIRNWYSQTIRIGLVGRNVFDYYYTEAVANLSPARSVVIQFEVK